MESKKDYQNYILYGLLIIAISILVFSIISLFNPPNYVGDENPTQSIGAKMTTRLSKMSLTAFDMGLAREFMDKDHDGRCDACGMPVEMCLDAGEMQCSMDSKSTIGKLGSQHIHADWKIYINGKALDNDFLGLLSMDMSKKSSALTSSLIHLDKGAPQPEKTGDIIHMHATGVPLWLFFKSIGGEFNDTCLVLPPDQQFCNAKEKKLRFYVNGKLNDANGNYVFKDLDKILISYGNDNDDINMKLSTITNFAKNH